MKMRRRISLWLLGIAVFLLWSYAMMVAWSVPVLVVFGSVKDGAGKPLDDWVVTVKNETQGWSAETTTGTSGESGTYQVTQVDFFGNRAAELGDVIRVTATEPGSNPRSLSQQVTLGQQEIDNLTVEVNFQTETPAPAPSLTQIEPEVVRAVDGEMLVLSGTSFQQGAVLIIGEVEIPITVVSDTEASAFLPLLKTGRWPATIKNPDGQSGTLENGLLVTSPSDFNGDGLTDIRDLVVVARTFGRTGPGLAGDVNGDGVVNITDLVLVARSFGESVIPAAPAIASAHRGAIVSRAMGALDTGAATLEIALDGRGSDISALIGYEIVVAFDPDLLHLRSVGANGAFGGRNRAFSHVWPADPEHGRVRFLAVALGADARVVEDALARLRFDVIGDAQAAIDSFRITRADLVDGSARLIRPNIRPVLAQIRFTEDARTLVGQNYPNPFNPETWIPYQLAEAATVRLRIYDSSGARVRELDLGWQEPGGHLTRDRAAYWDGRNAAGEPVASGVYFYELLAGSAARTGRMVIVK